MTSTTELLQLITDCEHRESKLTDWEREFLDSVRTRLENGGSLTPKQEDKLLTIWDRVTS